MRCVFATVLAELLQLQPRLQRLLVLEGVVVKIVTLGAFHLDKIVLRHT